MKKFGTFVDESGMTPVYEHLSSDRAVAIITAFREECEHPDNVTRNKQLVSQVKRAGYGYFYLDGHWVEENSEDGQNASEGSIFVVGGEADNGKLKGLCKKWIKEYNQDSVLFQPEGEKNVYLLYQDGRTESIGKFNANKVAQAYSRLRGKGERALVFENAYVEKNWLGKLAESKVG